MGHEVLLIILKWAIPAVLGLALGYLTTKVKELSKKSKEGKDAAQKQLNAVCEGVKCLLRERIYDQYERYYEHLRYCPLDARENVIADYEAYHALGGDQNATDLYKKIISLPTEEPEE